MIITALAALALASTDCNGVYSGYLMGQLPVPPYQGDAISGTLTDFYDDGDSAWATINGTVHRFQHPSLRQIEFDNLHCKFGGSYLVDPIFHDTE